MCWKRLSRHGTTFDAAGQGKSWDSCFSCKRRKSETLPRISLHGADFPTPSMYNTRHCNSQTLACQANSTAEAESKTERFLTRSRICRPASHKRGCPGLSASLTGGLRAAYKNQACAGGEKAEAKLFQFQPHAERFSVF